MTGSHSWRGLRTALCHEWFTTLGGSDVCAARIAGLLDVDAIFAFTYQRALVEELLGGREVRLAHKMGGSEAAREHWQRFLPLMPYAWRSLDLSGYDLVITSSHACTNAIRGAPGAVRVSYCYTPMRYAWEPEMEKDRLPALARPLWPPVAGYLRRADRRWAQRVDAFIAISETVAERIERCYGRDARVVYPPVDTDYFSPAAGEEDYFLVAGRLVGYKRVDIAVEAFGRLGRRLIVAGSGPELARLRKRARPNISFEVQPTRERLRELYRNARALVFPGIEDFGIVPVEAQSCGTPVIARNVGGVAETVVDGESGVLYDGDSAGALVRAIQEFEDRSFSADAIRQHSLRFSQEAFDASFIAALGSVLDD